MPDRESRQPPEPRTRFFYGYVIVGTAFIIMTLTFGANYTFGVFIEPLIAEFGWTRAAISGAYAVLTLVAGFWGIFAGRISDRLGPKIVGVIGGFCLGLGFVLMSQVTALWQVYLIYGLIIPAGIGGCWPVFIATVVKWFAARRGLITGIVAAGVGFGTMITPPLATWLISIYDWRATYGIVGIGTMVLIIAASLFHKRDPYQIGQVPHGIEKQRAAAPPREFAFRQVVRTRQFWMVCGIYFCFGYCLHSVMVHIVPHATGTGISPASAASILAAIGSASIIAKLIVGMASDRLGIKLTLTLALALLTATFIWLQSAGELGELYLFGIIFGFAYGGTMTMQPLLLAELFGLGSLGIIVGSVTFSYTVGSAIGPLIAGHIFDITASYRPAFIICAVMAVIAIILTLPVRPTQKQY
ncbi:MFS transporter [Chloroflexota bacterium]